MIIHFFFYIYTYIHSIECVSTSVVDNNIVFDVAKVATAATDVDGEVLRTDVGALVAPLDTDNTTVCNTSQGYSPMADEHQKQSSDTDGGQEAGQLEDDAEVDAEGDAGMIDGEIEPEVDLDPVS